MIAAINVIELLLVTGFWLLLPFILLATAIGLMHALDAIRELLLDALDAADNLRHRRATPPSDQQRTRTVPRGVDDNGVRAFGWDR